MATDLILSDPEDGTTEKGKGQLSRATNKGHKTGQWHTVSMMRGPAQYYDDYGHNLDMNANARRYKVNLEDTVAVIILFVHVRMLEEALKIEHKKLITLGNILHLKKKYGKCKLQVLIEVCYGGVKLIMPNLVQLDTCIISIRYLCQVVLSPHALIFCQNNPKVAPT